MHHVLTLSSLCFFFVVSVVKVNHKGHEDFHKGALSFSINKKPGAVQIPHPVTNLL